MRWTILALALTVWSIPSVASAQRKEKFKPPEIKRIHIGFQTFQEDERTTYKVGLWTPIYIDLDGGTDGIKAKDDKVPYVEIETTDSEDVGTKIRLAVDVDADKERTFIGHIKTGHMGQNFSEIKITLHVPGQAPITPRSQEMARSVDIDRHLYLVLGKKMLEFNRAVKQMNKALPDEKEVDERFETNFRQVVFETRVERLPEMWFAYQGVDLMILATEDNRAFLTALKGSHEKLKAIATWVRRGGRLIVPISAAQQDVVAEVLQSPAWQPAIPVTPPKAAEGQGLRLAKIPNMASWGGQILENAEPIALAALDPGNVPAGDWKVLLATSDDKNDDPKPLVAQVRYGLGQITYLALSLGDRSFERWPGKQKFLQTLINNTAPKAPTNIQERDFRGRHDIPNDVSTDMIRELDQFDVTVIPFGYVALFIILYILVVGPLDFVLLKYVFKRLEWTWITFPTVVLAVSVIAYFAAYALKGRDLKINKVDIIDFDLRTNLDRQTRQPASFHAYGHSFFTILSPRIQNYTVGLEPNPLFWGGEVKKVKRKDGREVDEVLSADLLSWMGRPSGGMHDMGRGGSGGFFRNAYSFKEDASAVEGVPIPVWTTKAFTASWERKLSNPPFSADLAYHLNPVRGKEMKITGTIANHLGVDLTDVWLIYDKHFYRIDGGLTSSKRGGQPHKVEIVGLIAPQAKEWWGARDEKDAAPRAWAKDPTPLVKDVLFTESLDPQGQRRNHLLRALDQSWRVQEAPRTLDRSTREVILFARVKYANGAADALMRDSAAPLPTKLWIGDTPATGKDFPAAPGNMNQDTYIRVFLPLRSGDD